MPPTPSLPTPFFKNVEGFSVESNIQKLSINIPAWMIPTRRYCQVYVSHNEVAKSYDLDIIHEEPYSVPTPSRNGWQTDYDRDGCGVKARRLDRDWQKIRGSEKDVKALRCLMNRGYWGSNSEQVFLRVMPEGFRITLHETGNFSMIRSLRGGQRFKERITEAVAKSYHHGLIGATPGARTGVNLNCRSVANHVHISVDRNPCSEQLYIPTQNQTGVNTMRKIDTIQVPFDTSGTKIVKATFNNTNNQQDYAYFADESIQGLEVGDFAVVISPYGTVYDEASQGYVNIVQITSLDEDLEGVTKASKWLVQKVDLASYRDRLAKAQRIVLLDARIETAKKAAMKLVELKKLMEASPELADLINERLSLSGASDAVETEKAVATTA